MLVIVQLTVVRYGVAIEMRADRLSWSDASVGKGESKCMQLRDAKCGEEE